MDDITRILTAVDRGDAAAAGELLPLVYQELRNLAARKLSREKPGQTLDATALVHEAYLRLLGPQGSVAASAASGNWSGRAHFFAAAAEAMRRILIESARRKGRLKGGGGRLRVELADVEAAVHASPLDLLALDEALQTLQRKDPRKAELVKLRFFAGLSIEQAAGVLGISTSTADNDWAYARSWLRLEMGREAGDGSDNGSVDGSGDRSGDRGTPRG